MACRGLEGLEGIRPRLPTLSRLLCGTTRATLYTEHAAWPRRAAAARTVL
jgi:hypothetical protein